MYTRCTSYMFALQVCKLAMLSLLAVFKDILPGYRIRLPTDKELEIPVSKEVKQTQDYEAMQLRFYQVRLTYGPSADASLMLHNCVCVLQVPFHSGKTGHSAVACTTRITRIQGSCMRLGPPITC